MSEMTRSAGRPRGAKAADPDAEIDRIIMNRRDQEADNREVANNKLRRAIRRLNEKEENRQAWLEFHENQGHRHLALARDHFHKKSKLAREETA